MTRREEANLIAWAWTVSQGKLKKVVRLLLRICDQRGIVLSTD